MTKRKGREKKMSSILLLRLTEFMHLKKNSGFADANYSQLTQIYSTYKSRGMVFILNLIRLVGQKGN